ncbi:hypothetical protein BD310DRAFT_669407 [Dichomitus squalens]|uniref:Uncharacterized protein n=1 Tax=Dichomitus squalens TaxID=114155 RepID=A0A4Q9PNB1_9APHY|nr:hypothetical protein BD310DRAFT_669407 [Dichomitus squalens]
MATFTGHIDSRPIPDMRKIPDWLLNHPELHKRGVVLHKSLQPFTKRNGQRKVLSMS